MWLTTRAAWAPGSESEGISVSQTASTSAAWSSVKNRRLRPGPPRPQEIAAVPAAARPAPRNARRGMGPLRRIILAVFQDAVEPLHVVADLVLDPREDPDEHAVDRLDAFEGGLKRCVQLLLAEASGRQDLECEARLFGLPHHLIHPRRIAAQVDLL